VLGPFGATPDFLFRKAAYSEHLFSARLTAPLLGFWGLVCGGFRNRLLLLAKPMGSPAGGGEERGG
jgi:hypothetical protein